MKSISGHAPFLILSLAVTAVVIAANFYMHSAIGIKAHQAHDATLAVAAASANKSMQASYLSAWQGSSADWSKLQAFFVPADQPVVFIKAIESLGKETNGAIKLATISADNLDGDAPGTIGTIRATLTASGPWSTVMQSLQLIESMPSGLTVDSVRLSSGGPQGKSLQNIWQASFTIAALEIVTK
jgi:hypothetical protein